MGLGIKERCPRPEAPSSQPHPMGEGLSGQNLGSDCLSLSVMVGIGFGPLLSVWVLPPGSDCAPQRLLLVWVPSPVVCAHLWLSGVACVCLTLAT